jgi:hypothetical protein
MLINKALLFTAPARLRQMLSLLHRMCIEDSVMMVSRAVRTRVHRGLGRGEPGRIP